MALKVGILISGRGSNMTALIDAAKAEDLDVEFVTVIANNPKAAGLEKAKSENIPVAVINHRDFETREEFDEALDAHLKASGAQLICLAGFMRLLTSDFVNRWKDRMINIHPSLLPSFTGLHTHERAIAAGVRFSGCTVHFVRAETDTGPIIAQAVVPIFQDDDPDTLASRILKQEHKIYPMALRLLSQNRISVKGERVDIRDSACPLEVIINPPL